MGLAHSKILVIEESWFTQATMKDLLEPHSVEITWEQTGRGGLRQARKSAPDIMVLNHTLPDVDGLRLCTLIREDATLADIPIIMITEAGDMATRVAAFEHGADQVLQRPFHRAELKAIVSSVSILNRFRKIATQRAEVEQMLLQVEHAYDATIEGWIKALDLRDQETEGHSLRVAQMAVELAQFMDYPEENLIHLRRGAILHDVGKLAIPDAVLHKVSAFTDEERAEMQRHPEYAHAMLRQIDYLAPALPIPYCHHEHWDGTGYPRGLKGTEIPLEARIFSVIDVFDALMCKRRYKDGWSEKSVLEFLDSHSGTHFDPAVVVAFQSFILERGLLARAG